MQKLKVIDEFKGNYKMFSNFYPVIIFHSGVKFPSVEHAYVASKSKDRLFRYRISQIPEDQAGKAKRRGEKIQLRENWDMLKLSYMRRFLIQKFSYRQFRELLISTGDATLIEGNYWHDNYWGDCYCPKCGNITGQNQLGKMLMKMRDTIK